MRLLGVALPFPTLSEIVILLMLSPSVTWSKETIFIGGGQVRGGGLGDLTSNLMMARYLQETHGNELDIHLLIEGEALEGYRVIEDRLKPLLHTSQVIDGIHYWVNPTATELPKAQKTFLFSYAGRIEGILEKVPADFLGFFELFGYSLTWFEAPGPWGAECVF